MRPVRALAVYIIVVFVGAALLAPGLYALAQAFQGTFPGLAGEPFHRFVNRSLLILALAGLWPLFRAIGAGSPADLGLVKPAGHGKELGSGFVLGFVSLALLAGLALATGARDINEKLAIARLLQKLLGAAGTAVVVSVLEEILFRGGIFGSLRRVFPWIAALVLSSAIYAIVHFMESARVHPPIHWYSGFEVLRRMLRGFADWHAIVPGFFNLTLAGLILGLAYQRTGNLYFSIGLHAGWIFWLKFYRAATVSVTGANEWWWGTHKLIDGWAATPVLVAALWLLPRLLPLRKSSAAP